MAKLKLRLFITISLLLVAAPASLWARNRFAGYAERGGQTFVTSLSGTSAKGMASYPLAQYDVFNTGTTTPATIFSDIAGTPKVCPCATDSVGYLTFYGDATTYSIRTSPAGVIPWTVTTYASLVVSSAGVFDVLSYGADPTGVADSSAAIQGAINDACLVSGLVTAPEGVFKVNSEITVNCGSGKAIIFRGTPPNYTGSGGTIFRAGAGERSVLGVLSKYHQISYLKLDANNLATYACYLANATLTRFQDIVATKALLDGFHCDAAGLNQGVQLHAGVSINNGKTYATSGITGQYTLGVAPTLITGTAGIVTSNATVTITGGPDITTLGIRVGNAGDMVRVGAIAATAFYGQITAVTHVGVGNDTITLQPSLNGFPTTTVAGQEFAIGIGFGWYEEINSANGRNIINDSTILRGNGCGGMLMNSLYGDRIEFSDVSLNNSCGIALGLISNNVFLNQPVVEHVYMEFNTGPDYVIGAVGDARIGNPSGGSALFSIGGGVTATTGIIVRGNEVESITFGKRQNFLIIIQRVGGVIKHQIVSTSTGFSALAADKVNGASATLATTPIGATALDSTHGFVTGTGVYAAATNFVVLDTPGGYANNGQIYGSVSLRQKITSGAQSAVPLAAQIDMLAANINGVTRNRLVLIITNGLTNAAGDLTNGANGLPVDGDFIAVRFDGYIK